MSMAGTALPSRNSVAKQQHALLVAARAEIARLAGEGEQIIVPAGIAVDTCEAVVRIAALDETLDRVLFHRALKSTRFAKLLAVALRAAPKRARARVAGAVHAASRQGTAVLRAGSPLPWFALRSHPG